MEIAPGKNEEQFEIVLLTLIPRGNGGVGAARDWKVFKDICNGQINVLMSFGFHRPAKIMVGPNL